MQVDSRRLGRALPATAVLVLAAATAACAEDGPVAAPSGSSRPSAASVTVPAPSSPAFLPGTTMLTGLRTGAHEGHDRVVLEFTGPVPPYRITREAGPIVDCASGAIRGGPGQYLVLRAEPVGIFDHDGYTPYTGPRTVAGPGATVSRAIIGCHFEGQLQVAVQLTGAACGYTDSTLTAPDRIVIDVQR